MKDSEAYESASCQWVRIRWMFTRAWDLLLTGKYTLDEICELLTQKGYTRPSGRPWAWTDSSTGVRRRVDNRLHKIIHNPFYAGWVVSERFGIKMGEVRGNWEPVVTTEEFYRGVEILHKNDKEKSRVKKAIYLLLLAKVSDLYPRLEEKKRSTLLQILVKRIIVNASGEIIDYELNSPFVYLHSLVRGLSTRGDGNGLGQIREPASISRKSPTGNDEQFCLC